MPEPSTQCVKLVRVWRPLVSDFDMVDISPCATVGSLKARFKDFTPPSAVEVIVNGELRGCHRHDEDPCAQDDLPLADGEFPENTIIHVNIHDAKTIADARERALGESCTLFDNRMDAYDPINKLVVQRKGPHALADTLTEHERRRPPHVPPPTAAAAAAGAGSAEASEGPWQVASARFGHTLRVSAQSTRGAVPFAPPHRRQTRRDPSCSNRSPSPQGARGRSGPTRRSAELSYR